MLRPFRAFESVETDSPCSWPRDRGVGSKTVNLSFSASQLASALELEFFYCVIAHIYVTIIFDLNITHPEQQRDWPKEAAATIPMEPVLIPTAQAGR